jgi:hypothetical protein
MASRGFEFVSMLDGSCGTPVIRDFTLGVAAAHHIGDLMLMQSDGYVDQVTTTTTEVTGVCMEEVAAAAITAGTTKAKLAILSRNQIWRCSSDGTSITAVPGYHKAVDTVDCNTVDASSTSGGAICILSEDTLDDDGYVIPEIVFLDTTFGNL